MLRKLVVFYRSIPSHALLDLDQRAELEKLHKEKDKQRAVLKTNYDNMKKEYNVLRSKEVDLTHQYEDAMKIVDENKRNANAYAAKITKLLNRKEALKIDPTDEATIKYYSAEELAEFEIDKINTVRLSYSTTTHLNRKLGF